MNYMKLLRRTDTQMGIKESLFQFGGRLFFERPGTKKSYEELIENLEVGGAKIGDRADGLMDGAYGREVLVHIIGIERWAQKRLKVFLGDAFIDEEYDNYRPSSEIAIVDLRKMFLAERNETVKIGREIHARHIADDMRVKHNDFQGINAKGWLYYVAGHAAQEAKGLK